MISYLTLISILLVAILIVFLNPTNFLMPESISAMLSLGLIIAFLIFTAMIWREKAKDERDDIHINKAGRASFIVGSAILVIAILSQASEHDIDPWLIVTLIAMVLSKIISRYFSQLKN